MASSRSRATTLKHPGPRVLHERQRARPGQHPAVAVRRHRRSRRSRFARDGRGVRPAPRVRPHPNRRLESVAAEVINRGLSADQLRVTPPHRSARHLRGQGRPGRRRRGSGVGAVELGGGVAGHAHPVACEFGAGCGHLPGRVASQAGGKPGPGGPRIAASEPAGAARARPASRPSAAPPGNKRPLADAVVWAKALPAMGVPLPLARAAGRKYAAELPGREAGSAASLPAPPGSG